MVSVLAKKRYDNLYRLDHSMLGSSINLQMAYDAMGDITSRSDVAGGATWTYDPVRKHAVTQAGSSSYTYAYDANGNVTSRNGSLIGWTSYNYPSGVSTATESATFNYGPNHQRWEMNYTGPSGVEGTYYATPKFEKVYAGGGGEYRSYIYAGNRPVVVVMRNTAGQIKVRSLLVDHQGSISSIITDSTGVSLVGESFTAYGNRREASTWNGPPTSGELTTMNGVTREGYTFQTVLGSMGLNHMNGRIEDSVTGRFLSADPGNTQSWNRYSYVNNNPLTYTDPTGFTGCVSDYCTFPPPWSRVREESGGVGLFGWSADVSYGDIGTTGTNIGSDFDPDLQPIVPSVTNLLNPDGTPQAPGQAQSGADPVGGSSPAQSQDSTQSQAPQTQAASDGLQEITVVANAIGAPPGTPTPPDNIPGGPWQWSPNPQNPRGGVTSWAPSRPKDPGARSHIRRPLTIK
jgi:RHS repeat-associated protein